MNNNIVNYKQIEVLLRELLKASNGGSSIPPTTITDIANIAAAVGVTYNTVEVQELISGSITFPANTLHSINWFVKSGSCTVTINGVTITYTENTGRSIEVTALINVPITITWVSGIIEIGTIKI